VKQRIWLTLLGIVILALYSSWGRPLWLDEYLHFSFGGFATPGEAWSAVQSSTVGINHGQTGFYIMIDYFTLKLTGANLFAMRLPSILSGALLLYATAVFLRTKRIGTIGITASFLLLASQPNLMYYVGEARPYMPLAASSVGVLAYYSMSSDDRKHTSARLLAWFSVIWGSLMMPYFLLYLPALIITTYAIDCIVNRRKPGVQSALAFMNIPLVITGFVLGLGISSMTWLRGSPKFDRDPWLYVRPLFDQHNTWVIAILIVASVIILLTVALGLLQGNSETRRTVLAAAILIGVVAVLALLLALASYAQNYWILPRQFVASQAIFDAALIWLLAMTIAAIRRPAKTILAVVLLIAVAFGAARAAISQIHQIADWAATGIPGSDAKPGTGNAFQEVAPANQNVLEGGPVWPELATIYDRSRILPNEIP
jgi:hypothetical protein